MFATSGHGPDRPHEVSYTDAKVIGNGSFGVVYQAKLVDTGEVVAIKKVLQDKRFKVRPSRLSVTPLCHASLSHPFVTPPFHAMCSSRYLIPHARPAPLLSPDSADRFQVQLGVDGFQPSFLLLTGM